MSDDDAPAPTHDPSNPECDLVIYGNAPGARGVVCTCDVDGGSPAAAPDVVTVPSAGRADQGARDLVLKGAQAETYARYIAAARRMKEAEAEAKAAASGFREALAAFTDANA